MRPSGSSCGTQCRYDERGNLLERIENGNTGKFTWDLYDRLRRYDDDRLVVEYDNRDKAHINTFNRKNERTICFEATQKTAGRIIRRFNR